MTYPPNTSFVRDKLYPVMLFVFLSLAMFMLSFGLSNESVQKYSGDKIHKQIRLLSSDYMQGRVSGSDTPPKALSEIVLQYEKLGLYPAFTANKRDKNFIKLSYMQKFAFEDGYSYQGSLVVDDQKSIKATPLLFNTPHDQTLNIEREAPLTFAGYCVNENLQSVKGLIVVCLRYGHHGKEGSPTSEISFASKELRLRKAEAAGVIFVNVDEAGENSMPDPPIYPLSCPPKSCQPLPSLFMSQPRTMDMLKNVKGNVTIRQEKNVFKSYGWNGGAYLHQHRNDERLFVIGAHYDHLGYGNFSSREGMGKIHNGADDNASGSALVLALAEEFKELERLGKLPDKTNFLFLHFDAEERGLFGSGAFLKSASNLNMSGMMNLDMVGNLREQNGIFVQGAWTMSPSAVSFLDHPTIHLLEGGSGPSDHDVFYKAEIPVLYVTTGSHSRYHTSEDRFDKMEVKHLAFIKNIVSNILLRWSAIDPPPKFIKDPRGVRFDFNLTPSFSVNEVEGNIEIASIRKSSPAERSGLKIHDRILSVMDQKKIHTLRDFENAFGDATARVPFRVTILRDNKELSFSYMLIEE